MGAEFCQRLFLHLLRLSYWFSFLNFYFILFTLQHCMVFIFQFVNVVYHIDWFANIEVSLHPWDKSHLVMMSIWLTFEEDHSRSCVESRMERLNEAERPMKKWQVSEWVKVAQSCLTLCDPMDYIVHGILQARILEWVAFPFSRRSSQSGDWTRSPALQVDSLPAEPWA